MFLKCPWNVLGMLEIAFDRGQAACAGFRGSGRLEAASPDSAGSEAHDEQWTADIEHHFPKRLISWWFYMVPSVGGWDLFLL